ncbi:MAG: EAL domain-containing protein [Proteobacteria bacterium]|nr:EAL domain-containing protein [Pseudomonadota bacterium]
MASGLRLWSLEPLSVVHESIDDRSKARLFGPIVAMTTAGLALLVFLAVFLVMRFDQVAAQRETRLVQSGFERQLAEFDGIVNPQVNWDDAVLNLDQTFTPGWADLNLGSYLFTYNGFTRAFVLDRNDQPIYASVKGERARIDAYRPFAAAVSRLLPRIRAQEQLRPPLTPSTGNRDIITRPIQAHSIADIGGIPFVIIVTLVQPDVGRIVPRSGRAPISINAIPIDGLMLEAFAARYLVDDLHLHRQAPKEPGITSIPLRGDDGKQIAVLAWTPGQPGMDLLEKIWGPALAALVLLSLIAWTVVRSGAAIFSELLASEARARHLAFHDPLTKLPNRAMLFARLQPRLAEITAGSPPLAVLAVDLDRFKDVNDSLGHHAGDALIQSVAARLRQECDDSALIARLGGDEFVVLLNGTTREAAVAMADRIVAAVRKPHDSEYGRLEAGCSVGVAVIEHAGVDPSEALRWADLALYRSKEAGRARVTFFEVEMDAALRDRRSLETDLRSAMNDGSLRMVYQPQVDRAGRIVAVEALLRWKHPVRGNVPPGVFVPLAEECGLILPLGEFVMRRVFEETGRWTSVRTAINVSAVQLRSSGFAAQVMRLVAQVGIDPTRYEIELTETALLGDDPLTAANVEALKRMGFSIALDDFGTGYSSLSVLQRFSVDKIKIDRSFVATLGGGAESEALVDAMIRLARALKLEVIAEGVETERQKERLISCGCREFQGHLIGMPMRSDDLAALIGDGSSRQEPRQEPGQERGLRRRA